MKKLFLLPLSLLCMNTMAGTTTVRGISNIGQTPDYLELNINVSSKCHESAEASNNDVNTLSTSLRDIIFAFTGSDPENTLVVQAGLSERKDVIKYKYNEELQKNEEIVICKDGWFSSRKVVAKFTNTGLFERMNPALLFAIDQAVNDKLEASIQRPIPRLLPESTRAMQDQALEEALIDASRKMQIMKRVCGLENVQITDISEARGVALPYKDQVKDNGNISFIDQYVHLAFNITFEFTNTSGVCSAAESLL